MPSGLSTASYPSFKPLSTISVGFGTAEYGENGGGSLTEDLPLVLCSQLGMAKPMVLPEF